jgi:hypothetical protein
LRGGRGDHQPQQKGHDKGKPMAQKESTVRGIPIEQRNIASCKRSFLETIPVREK